MHLLFVKHSLAWPRSSGHDVNVFEMMKAFIELGERVSLATAVPPSDSALKGLTLEHRRLLAGPTDESERLPLTRMQERFRSYWGVEKGQLHRLRQMCREIAPDAVITAGLPGLPYLGCVSGAVRVWYANDDYAWHYLTLIQTAEPGSWSNLKDAAIMGLYERTYRRCIDRVWVVSKPEATAMRWIAGVDTVDVLPSGLDGDFFRPIDVEQIPHSAVFWGRLDFGPNIQGLQWFCREIWPAVRRRKPDARFTIIGFNPTEPVRALTAQGGISLLANLPDLRAEVCRHALVLLPFVSGGGIKTKLLEAAGLGKAIVCTPRALGGLRRNGALPFVSAADPATWAQEVVSLWNDEERRRRLGEQARAWVLKHHTWAVTARDAIRGLRAAGQRAHI